MNSVLVSTPCERLPQLLWTADAAGSLTAVNVRFAEYLGCDAARACGEGWTAFVHPLDRDAVEAAWRRACAGDATTYAAEYRLRRADGAYAWFLARAERRDDAPASERWVGTCTDVDERYRAWRAAQTDNIFAHEFIENRRRVESGLTLLSRTSAAMLNSLSVDMQLHDMARALIDDFASFAVIDLVGPQGDWQRISMHRDPRLDDLIRKDGHREPKGAHPIAETMRSHRPTIVRVDAAWKRAFGETPERIALIEALGLRSLIIVPIVTPGAEIVGAVTCGLDDGSEREAFVPEDLPFIEEVGRRAGTAYANARLYEREHRIAVAMQQASLPTLLPNLDSLGLSAYYRPGSAEATIGGDWYDAFLLPDGRAVFTVGDVLGNGLTAAVVMTKLRQAIQSVALMGGSPGTMLEVADQTLIMHGGEKYATAIVAIYDRATHRLEVCSAGHPGPTLRYPDGEIEDLIVPGLMLGVTAGTTRETMTRDLPEGTMLVLYTDGLIEAGRDLEEGMRRMRAALNDPRTLRADRPARALVKAVLADQPASDDTAVLIAYIPA